jgi:hypothetical protein
MSDPTPLQSAELLEHYNYETRLSLTNLEWIEQPDPRHVR